MAKWLILFLLANLMGTVAYALYRAKRKESIGLVLFFLFLPGLGFVFYFAPQWIQKTFLKQHYDRDSLVKRLAIPKNTEQVDVERELNVVPVKDAMAVSDNFQKRSLLLNQLRKDIHSNYRELLAAEADEDSESAHYVAAAKMEVYAARQKEWTQALKAHQADPDNEELFEQMLGELERFLDSGLLSAREETIYKKRYCDFVRETHGGDLAGLNGEILKTYLRFLVDLKEYGQALQLWKTYRPALRSEACYMKMLAMFYAQRDKAQFDQCIRELQADAGVRLSASGLESLRYWLERT